MKEIKKYIAFDGTEFDTRTECNMYEQEGFEKQLNSKLVQFQIAKSLDLPMVTRKYETAKKQYKIACTTKMDISQRLTICQSYFAAKTIYDRSVEAFQKLKKEIRLLQIEKKAKKVE